MKKVSKEILQRINSMNTVGDGKIIRDWLQGRLDLVNEQSAFEVNQIEKYHFSGRAQELYDLIHIFDTARVKLDKLQTNR